MGKWHTKNRSVKCSHKAFRIIRITLNVFSIQFPCETLFFLYSWTGNKIKNDSLKESNCGGPPHLTNFAHISHVNFFMGSNYEMDDFKFQLFLVWKTPRRPVSSGLASPPFFQIIGVLVI